MASGIQRFVQGSNEYAHDKNVASNMSPTQQPHWRQAACCWKAQAESTKDAEVDGFDYSRKKDARRIKKLYKSKYKF